MFEWKWGNLSLWCEWVELLRLGQGFNWINFHPINIEFEYDKHGPCAMLTIILIGFAACLNIYLPWKTPQRRKLDDILADMKTQDEMPCVHCGKVWSK